MIFLRRLANVAVALLVLLDIIACFIWLATLHPFGLASAPNGRQMISGYIGRAAINGHHWAYRAERVIDWLFQWHEPQHCRTVARKYAGYAD